MLNGLNIDPSDDKPTLHYARHIAAKAWTIGCRKLVEAFKPRAVIRGCEDGRLNGTHSKKHGTRLR